jgi:hypothetical protein
MVRPSFLVLLALCTAPCVHAGAWGFGTFENDDALDWLSDLESTSGTQLLEAAVRQVDTKANYVEAPTCSVALAAAEVIAAANGRPAQKLPPEVAAWIKRVRSPMNASLLMEARLAVEKCRGPKNSELRELWQKSKDEKAWLDDTAGLLERLAVSSNKSLERTRDDKVPIANVGVCTAQLSC